MCFRSDPFIFTGIVCAYRAKTPPLGACRINPRHSNGFFVPILSKTPIREESKSSDRISFLMGVFLYISQKRANGERKNE